LTSGLAHWATASYVDAKVWWVEGVDAKVWWVEGNM
jgi:hypothetical protein